MRVAAVVGGVRRYRCPCVGRADDTRHCSDADANSVSGILPASHPSAYGRAIISVSISVSVHMRGLETSAHLQLC